MDKTSNSNNEPRNPTPTHEGIGESSNSTSPTGIRRQEDVPSVNAASMEDTGEGYVFLTLREVHNLITYQGPEAGCSSTQSTAPVDRMDIDKQMGSSSHENDHQVVSESVNGQDKPIVECGRCGEKFSSIASIRAHFPCTPKGSTELVCDLCQASFRTNRELCNHKRFTHSGAQKEVCSICGARFRWRKALLLHRREQHPVFRKPCMTCKTVFRTESGLESHELNAHKENAKLSCDVCGVRFTTIRYLIYHRCQQHRGNKVSGGVSKSYPVRKKYWLKCPHCEYSSRYERCFSQHVAAVHSDGAPKYEPKSKLEPETDDSYECSHGCGYKSEGYATMICHERTCAKARRRG